MYSPHGNITGTLMKTLHNRINEPGSIEYAIKQSSVAGFMQGVVLKKPNVSFRVSATDNNHVLISLYMGRTLVLTGTGETIIEAYESLTRANKALKESLKDI